jgi:hypothetical protein
MTVPTPAVNVPDEIVKKVDALVDTATTLEAVSHGDVDVLVSGPEANAEYKAARTDLLATIARHITPAPPSDAELREAVERCKLYIDDFRLVGDTTTAAAISTVLRAVQAPASGETDAGFEGLLDAFEKRVADVASLGGWASEETGERVCFEADAARTAVIAEHNRAIAAAYEDAAKICARSVIAEGERE